MIERSISMCRLNFRDSDLDYMRNGANRSRVRERSYMFQRDSAKPPPKILVSSVSEDRSTMPSSFRRTAARSWSSEDFLADSPHMEDASYSTVQKPEETSSEVLINSTSNSPQQSYAHSPTGSSLPESVNTESVIEDSAISSPDSWVESEFGVTPEKLCESRSDSSLCDSGTAWDVYRATPVEITTLDEGFVPSTEDKAPDDRSITDSYIDEGIYSMSTLESLQERIHGDSGEKQAEVTREEGANLEKHNQDAALKQVPDHSEESPLHEGKAPRDEEPSSGLTDAEGLANSGFEDLLETKNKTNQSQLASNTDLPPSDHCEGLVKQTSVEHSTGEPSKKAVDLNGDAQDHAGLINGQTESQDERKNKSEEVEVEAECQKTKSSSDVTRGESGEGSEISEERDEGIAETGDKASEGILKEYADPKESSEICDALANAHPNNQDGASSLDPSIGMNIPLISISSEPEQQDEEGTCDPERRDQAGDGEAHQAEAAGGTGTDTDVNSPQSPDESSCYSSDSTDKNSVDIPSSLVSESVKPTPSEQTRDIKSGHLDDTNIPNISRSSNSDICGPDTIDTSDRSEVKQEGEPPQHDSQTDNTEMDLTAQNSSTDVKSQPANTQKEKHLTDQLDGGQVRLGCSFSDKETAAMQQNTGYPVDSKPDGTTGSVPRDEDLFYTGSDRNSPTDDLVGDPVEPMDLFYPDKEEAMFTEPPDTEMQSWPSVLSVSPLQPAPTSEMLSDDQPLTPLGEDFRNGLDSVQEEDETNVSLFNSLVKIEFFFKISDTYLYSCHLLINVFVQTILVLRE